MESNNENNSYSFDDIINDPAYHNLTKDFHYSAAEFHTDENDYYRQLGDWYKLLNEETKNNLVKNVTGYIKNFIVPKSEYMMNMQLCHWFRANINLGIAITRGLDLDFSEMMKQLPKFSS
jgi:catalase